MKKISRFYKRKFTEMTSEDAQFNEVQLNDLNRSLKRRKKGKITTLVRETWQNMKKISQIDNGKFTELELK